MYQLQEHYNKLTTSEPSHGKGTVRWEKIIMASATQQKQVKHAMILEFLKCCTNFYDCSFTDLKPSHTNFYLLIKPQKCKTLYFLTALSKSQL